MSLLGMTLYMLGGAAFVCGLAVIIYYLPTSDEPRKSASHSD